MKKPHLVVFTRQTISNLIVLLAGISFYLFWANYNVCMAAIRVLSGILLPFFVAFGMAFLLNTPMKWFEKLFRKFRHRRLYAIMLTYVIAIAIISALFAALIPEVLSSALTLFEKLPSYLEGVSSMVLTISEKMHIDLATAQLLVGSWEELVASVASWAQKLLPQVFNFSVAIGSGLINALMSIIVSIYMLTSKDTLKRQAKKVVFALLPKEKAEHVVHIGVRSNEVFSGFINGKLLDSAIIGTLCFLIMCALQLQYAALISVVVGITNMIPFFGPFFGAIPSILILVIIDPWQALIFTVLIFFLQQFDGNILGPKILGDSTGLSPMWVLVAIVVGGGLFGFIGMLIGVPSFAVIYSIVSDYLQEKLEQKGITQAGESLGDKE